MFLQIEAAPQGAEKIAGQMARDWRLQTTDAAIFQVFSGEPFPDQLL
jgi:hypothetical protein